MKNSISILGCGWLGLPLAISLIKQGYTVKGSTTSVEKMDELRSSGILPFLIDIEHINVDQVNQFLQSNILIVNIPSKNVAAFRDFISHLSQSSIEQTLFISSTSVYAADDTTVTEETPTTSSPLREIEVLFQKTTLNTTVLRFAGLMGYDRKPGNWFSGRKIPNPEGYVNMIHRDDCIEIMMQIIDLGIWNEVFNGCADTHPSRREFYTTARAVINKPAPEFDMTRHPYKIVSNERLKEVLDYAFIFSDVLKMEQMP